MAFTIAALIAIAAFAMLSRWQWLRAEEERTASQSAIERGSMPAVPLSAVTRPEQPLPDDLQWRSVVVSGQFDCDRGALVRNRPQDGSNGFWVVCPVTTPDGTSIYVNRGWVAASAGATAEVSLPAAPTGTVQVTGSLRPRQPAGGPRPADLPTYQVTQIDTVQLCEGDHLPSDISSDCSQGSLYLPYVQAQQVSPIADEAVKPVSLPQPAGGRQLSYAGQWLLFAAIAVVGWYYFLWREAGEAADDPAPQTISR